VSKATRPDGSEDPVTAIGPRRMIDGEEEPMTTLVAYASRYGASQGIAERIGARLADAGLPVDVRSVSDVADPACL